MVGVIGASVNVLRLFEIVGLTAEPCLHLFTSREAASASLAREDR